MDACKQLDGILNTEAKLKKGMIMINDQLVSFSLVLSAVVVGLSLLTMTSSLLTLRTKVFFIEYLKIR